MSSTPLIETTRTTTAVGDDVLGKDEGGCKCIGILLILVGVILLLIAGLELVDYKDWILSQNPCYCNPYSSGPGNNSAGWVALQSVKTALLKAVLPLAVGILLVWLGVHKLKSHCHKHAVDAAVRTTRRTIVEPRVGLAESSIF
jgi:hypothetical protein